MTNSKENLSRPGIIDARARYRAAARRLRNTALGDVILATELAVCFRFSAFLSFMLLIALIRPQQKKCAYI